MDSGWVAALASIVSAVVVAVTAIAALRQLRHNRNANDISVYLRLIDRLDAPEMVAARVSLALVAERVREDASYRERLKDPRFVPDEFRGVGELLRFLEHMSVLVIKGGVAESLILAEYADTFVDVWNNIRPAMAERRIAYGPHTGRAFEHLAMRARRYIESGEMDREYDNLQRDSR